MGCIHEVAAYRGVASRGIQAACCVKEPRCTPQYGWNYMVHVSSMSNHLGSFAFDSPNTQYSHQRPAALVLQATWCHSAGQPGEKRKLDSVVLKTMSKFIVRYSHLALSNLASTPHRSPCLSSPQPYSQQNRRICTAAPLLEALLAICLTQRAKLNRCACLHDGAVCVL